MATVKFNKHHVAGNGEKARCFYSVDNRYGGGRCVTIYAKDFASGRALGGMFPEQYVNRTDTQSDYFDMGHVELLEGHPSYAAARVRAEAGMAPAAPVEVVAPPRPLAVEDVVIAPRAMTPWRDWAAANLAPATPMPRLDGGR